MLSGGVRTQCATCWARKKPKKLCEEITIWIRVSVGGWGAGILMRVVVMPGYTSQGKQELSTILENMKGRQRQWKREGSGKRCAKTQQDSRAHTCRNKWRHRGWNTGVFIGFPPRLTLLQGLVCKQFIFEVISRSTVREMGWKGRKSNKLWSMSRFAMACSSCQRLSQGMCGTCLRTVPLQGQ